jgi:hypothetical protein
VKSEPLKTIEIIRKMSGCFYCIEAVRQLLRKYGLKVLHTGEDNCNAERVIEYLDLILDRLLQNANFPNFYVGKINLILGIPRVCLWSNLFSALNLKKFSFRNSLSMCL